MIGNPLETATALAHLIYEGTLDRFPGLKIAAAHGGGYLPSYIGRFDHGHNSADRGGRGLETGADPLHCRVDGVPLVGGWMSTCVGRTRTSRS